MEGIELKDFIRSTLVEIAEGVREANQGLMGSGKSQHDIFNLRRNFGDSSKIPGIIFDIAVTATSNKAGQAGIKLAIASIGVGAKIEDGSSNEFVHRIKFEIGINNEWT